VRDGLLTKGFMKAAERLDRRWRWHRLPKPLAVPTMIGLRMALRRFNLFDTSGDGAAWGPERPVPGRSMVRSATGTGCDPINVGMGSAGSRFGRNVPLEYTFRQEVLEPNPRTISSELLARRAFVPAPALNLLTAAWIQFEVHDWMSHGPLEPTDPWEVELDDADPWPARPMHIGRTRTDPSDGGPPTYRNTQSHWWDASQVYGSHPKIEELLRAKDGTGHLRLTDDGVIPIDPPSMKPPPDVDVSGAANWWIGLAMFHTIFMREHNAICDRLACLHPDWTDQQLYDHARLVNAALIAKIHTLEWTPALFAHPETKLGMKLNWWGVQGERVWRRFGRLTKSEILSGIPRSELYYHGAPYAITEEFVAVYRLHPLVPDELRILSASDGRVVEELPFDRVAGKHTKPLLDDRRLDMADLFYSFGLGNPGAVVLHNYPNHLREFTQPDGSLLDVAAIDILRNRERGVPRYNQFRRLFRLDPAARFEDFSDDPSVVDDLRRIYATPDDVDLIVGMYAEQPPEGFAISDTAFRVFLLMASRRLKSDRFFTYDYRPEVYTQEGLDWIEDNTLRSVILRHYPNLEPALRGVTNAFEPWNDGTRNPPGDAGGPRWRLRRGFWDRLVRFKFHAAKPLVVPTPTEQAPIVAVPFTEQFPDIPISSLVVADHIPKNELEPRVLLFVKVQSWLARVFPAMLPGLPPVARDPQQALADAYPAVYRRAYRAPFRPPEYDGDVDLGHLAVASPYACYLRQNGDGLVNWDLVGLDRFERHDGLRSPFARVQFEVDGGARRLRAVGIECELGMCRPGDHDWTAAQHLAMCATATDVTLVRHFNWIHLVCGGPLAIATHNFLPPTHPIRRLLHPHVHATHFSNRIVTQPQMEPAGDFESTFSYTHRGMCELFEATCGDFDLRTMDPELDAERRGIIHLPIEQPAFENRCTLMAVIRHHVSRYLSLYYDDDVEIAADAVFGRWLDELSAFVPHGVRELSGSPVTLRGAATLLSTLIYMGSVDHEIADSGVWDYQLWNDVQPVRVYRSGQEVPLDVYQRLVNSNFILNVDRTRLMSDFAYLAIDQRGADAFHRFRRDLIDLQRIMDRDPATCWRIEPRQLKANINY
jgi:hypothetical protein